MKIAFALSLIVIACAVIPGCDLGKTKELAAHVEQLKADNARLDAETQRLQAETQRLQAELDATKKQFEQLNKAHEQLLAGAGARLQQFIKQYGAGLDAAKDLGLPELQDFSTEDLLKKLFPSAAKPEGKPESP